MTPMFDPVYVTEVLNDILGRRGLQVILIPKDSTEPGKVDGEQPAPMLNGEEIRQPRCEPAGGVKRS